jgi:simple sugar transport system substrate-binding protein
MTEKRRTMYSSGPRPSRVLKAVVPAAIASVALAACTGGHANSSSGGGGGSANGKSVSVVMLGGPSSDPFFSTIKAGADAAVAAYGSKLKLTYLSLQNYDNLGPDMAKLESTAASQNPDVVVSTDWVPSAQNAGFKQLVSKNIPVVLYNAGGDQAAKDVGAVSFVGTDDTNVGQIAAQRFVSDGSKNIVCVNTTPGSQNNEDRCHGLIATATAAGAKGSQLELPATSFGNPSAVSQAVKAYLLKNPSIDGVFTIGAADADSAAAGIEAAGGTSKIKLGNAGVGSNSLDRIKSGKQDFSVDIEPYLQGYLAVSQAYQYVAFGLQYTSPTPTGPLTITSDNVSAAIDAAKQGLR